MQNQGFDDAYDVDDADDEDVCFYYFEAMQSRSLADMNWRRPVHETLPGKTFIMKPACFMGRCVLAQDELEANTTAQLVVEVVVNTSGKHNS